MIPLTGDGSGGLYFQGQKVGEAGAGEDRGWTLVARPERIFFAHDEAETDDRTIVLKGVLRETVFQGESKMALVAIDDGTELAVRFGTGGAASPSGAGLGGQVSIGLERSDVIFIPSGKP